MDVKQQVVNRLLGMCECESSEEGCGDLCMDEELYCSREPRHKGNHFACAGEHKIHEWD